MKIIFFFFLILIFTFSSFAQKNNNSLPKVWMTYYDGSNIKEDFLDMKRHGVDAVEVGIWGIEGNSRAKEILTLARKIEMKLIIGIPEIAEQAYNFPQDKLERAVMMGGAYNGKAIDRFRFKFTPEKHSITIESPVYDSTNCYGNIGRYFMGLTPVNAEVVVKLADYDGEQHLKIIKAQISPQKENFWNMEFDLTGVKGDLDNVVLAVFWTSEGTRDYWIFGDAVSMYSEGFKNQLQNEVKKVISSWEVANNGIFPAEIIAIRYGDECFHISGHLNSEDCSYPMWDFSESAIKKFRETSSEEYPRGVGWTDMYGHQANARWMYNFHEAAANSVKTVKRTFNEEGIFNVPIFRNMTRMNIFDVMNDWDGSGIDLLSKEFDLLHLDPYPVNANGYDKTCIPRDMSYVEGLSRRYQKLLVPWMQAHVYGLLNHPSPSEITEMMKQQMQYNNDAIIWLGFGGVKSGNTFPNANKSAWEQASKEHNLFKAQSKTKRESKIAVIRPYTVRSIRGANCNSVDYFLTNNILEKVLFDFDLRYDPFEPLICEELETGNLNSYSWIIAEIGMVTRPNLKRFLNNDAQQILIISGAEYEKSALEYVGIQSVKSSDNEDYQLLKSHSEFNLEDNVEILIGTEKKPLVWRKGNRIIIGKLPEKDVELDFLSNFFMN